MACIFVNSGGTWKYSYGKKPGATTTYSKCKINVGGTWKTPKQTGGVQLNVGGTWQKVSR